MSADLKCAVDYKRLPLCLTIDHHLYRPLYSLSALNRDSRYHSLSVCPCSKIAGCPTFRFQTHRDARTHTHTIAQSPVGMDVWPDALRTGAYTVSANLSPTSCFGGKYVHFISFSQTINVLWKGQYKPQSLKSLLKNAFVPLLFLKDQE